MEDKELVSVLKNIETEINKIKKSNQLPQWNASHIGDVPIDTRLKKHGWGFAYNEKTDRFEFYPVTDNKFFDHNELKNYKKEEHRIIKDEEVTKKGLWSSARITKLVSDKYRELKSLVSDGMAENQDQIALESKLSTKRNSELKEEDKRLKSELEGLENKINTELKDTYEKIVSDKKELSKFTNNVQSEILKILDTKSDKDHSHKEFKSFATREVLDEIKQEINEQVIDVEVSQKLIKGELGKKADNRHRHEYYPTKGEVNKRIKALSERIKTLRKSVNSGIERDEVVKLVEDRTPWGHRHRAGDVRIAGDENLEEALNNRVRFWGTYSSEPSVDAVSGDEYWNTGNSSLYKYISGSWVQIGAGESTGEGIGYWSIGDDFVVGGESTGIGSFAIGSTLTIS